jgi:predicted thioesterase
MENIKLGLASERNSYVTNDRTATQIGSGDVEAFGTPAMIALMEAAAKNTLAPQLSAGETSVGIYLEIEHLAPTPLGGAIRARAEVTEVNENIITFKVEAWDEQDQIGKGTHRRMVVDHDRFMKRVDSKKS